MIDIRNLIIRYPNGDDLTSSLTFKIPHNKVVTLFGPNGCGKTRILNYLSGINDNFIYECREGKDTIPLSNQISYVTQDLNRILLNWRSPIDNVALPLVWSGKMNKREARNFAHKELIKWNPNWKRKELTGITNELSGGGKSLVALTREFIRAKKLILIDEGFSSIDLSRRFKLLNLIRSKIIDNKISVFSVTHSFEEAVYFSDLILIVSNTPSSIIGSIVIERKKQCFHDFSDPEFDRVAKKTRTKLNEIISD